MYAGPLRVVMADDEPLARDRLRVLLAGIGGVEVVAEAGDGHAALHGRAEHHPDLVLLDLNMPHCDGWTAFSQLDRITPLVPVIVLTARPNQYSKAVQLGVAAFMGKRVNIRVLGLAAQE